MEEISLESVRAAVEQSNPFQEAMAILMKDVATDAVSTLAGVLSILGQNPEEISGMFIVQAVLVEAERVFASISRDDWIRLYDSYQAVKEIIDANPDIKEALNKRQVEAEVAAVVDAALDDLLDGKF